MNTAALAVNLAINYICLKTIGYYGAAVGSTLSYSLVLIGWYFIMRRLIGFHPRNIGKYMLETYITIYSFGMQLIRRKQPNA